MFKIFLFIQRLNNNTLTSLLSGILTNFSLNVCVRETKDYDIIIYHKIMITFLKQIVPKPISLSVAYHNTFLVSADEYSLNAEDSIFRENINIYFYDSPSQFSVITAGLKRKESKSKNALPYIFLAWLNDCVIGFNRLCGLVIQCHR